MLLTALILCWLHLQESSTPSRVPQCVHGCQKALESYLRNLAGDPSKHPRVEWRRARKHGGVVFRVEKGDLPTVFFRVQYKVQTKDWEYYNAGQEFNLSAKSESYELAGFKPFTEYQVSCRNYPVGSRNLWKSVGWLSKRGCRARRFTSRIEDPQARDSNSLQFRLAWTVSTQFEALFTQPSPVKTSEFGPPQGAPQKVTCALMTHNQVTVSWRPPEYPASMHISYLLEAHDDQGNPPLVHVSANPGSSVRITPRLRGLRQQRIFFSRSLRRIRQTIKSLATCSVLWSPVENIVCKYRRQTVTGTVKRHPVR